MSRATSFINAFGAPRADHFALFDSYLPAIGRFLIVVTFFEDALRIVTQWSDQLLYLKDYRHSKMRIAFLIPDDTVGSTDT